MKVTGSFVPVDFGEVNHNFRSFWNVLPANLYNRVIFIYQYHHHYQLYSPGRALASLYINIEYKNSQNIWHLSLEMHWHLKYSTEKQLIQNPEHNKATLTGKCRNYFQNTDEY